MNLEQSQKRIRELMSRFVYQVESATAMGQTDINKVAETILTPLIAEIYGYKNLKNLNFTEGSNFPSIDLGDETARVAFQITATPGIEKVKHTLTKFVEYKYYEKYDRIIIYIITEKQKSYSDTEIKKIINGKFSFDVKKDIWDKRDILEEVTNFQIEKAREVEKILEANFGEERREPDREVVDKVEQIINQYTQLFVGRSEEFQKLDNFLANHSSGVMLVTAGAGFGKTSLLANWVKERQGNGCFIAYHFFSQQYDKTRSVKSAYWNLLRQIYRYYELYYEQLPNERDELRKRLNNILKERGAREDKPLVIVIDGLDEIDASDIPFSLPFLTSLPQNVFVIASARAESGEEPKYLENWSERAQKLHLERLPRGAIADWLKGTGDGELATFADNNFVVQLDEITQGFPLYLNYLTDEFSYAAKQKQNIRQLLTQTPKGFENYVKEQLKHLDELDLPDERWQFFALLAVAKGALEKQDVKAITGMRDRSLRQLHQCWQVTRWMRISEDKLYAFAHPLLGTTFAAQLGDDAEDALQDLIKYCSQWQEKHSSYALRYYAEHLQDIKQWNKLYELARNEDFSIAQREHLPDRPDLPLNTVQTSLLGAALEDKPGEMAEFLLLHIRRLVQTNGQDSPLDALRKGYLERAWRLTDLYEIERRILWYLLLAWELKDTGRFEEARQTLQRLQDQELPRLSTHPDIEWQSDYATYLLAHVFEVSEDICTSLEQKLLNDRYRCILCANLSDRGNFAAALKTVQGVSSQISWQVSVLLNIAKAQAQKGDIEYSATFANACTIVQKLVSSSWWEYLIGKIAEAQLEVGDLPEAKNTLIKAVETADNFEKRWHRVNAFISIANIQAELGMLAEATETLRKLEGKPDLGNFSISIGKAKVNFKIGNKKRARDILARAVEIANGIEDGNSKVDQLKVIAITQAEIGEFKDAGETAKKINCSDGQAYALMKIAIEQAKVRDFTTALETIKEIEIKHYHSQALFAIATSQAEAINFPDAIVNASRIEEPFKAQALQVIAIAQADANPSTDDALETAEQIESNPEQMEALVGIVRIQAQVKNFPALLKIKDKVRGKERKHEVLSAIAEAYAKAEDFTTALEIAKQIDVRSMQAKTLGVIAEIQARYGQYEAARSTFANVLKSEQKPETSSSFMRASALVMVAKIQVKNAQKEVGAATACMVGEIAQSIDSPVETANLLATIVQILVEAEKIQEAKNICARACEIAQQISHNREHQRSQSFGSIAEAQARLGDFDVALRTLEEINIPYFYVHALRSITQLQVEANPQQIEKCKIALNKADEDYKSADPLSFEFLNMLKALTIIAVARSTLGETGSSVLVVLKC